MLASILALSAVALGATLGGLVAMGHRWRHAGPHWGTAYGFVVLAFTYLVGDRWWRLPRAELWTGCVLLFAAIAIVSLLKRDWSPPTQAFFASLGWTCVVFVVFASAFSLSGRVSLLEIPAELILIGFEVFAFGLLLIGTHEVLDAAGRVRWHRRVVAAEAHGYVTFVSIHVPTHNEPPELVLKTLGALHELDYPAYEVLVIDNNTDDEALWRPVERYCDEVGFVFTHLENWPGYKAGALNHALDILDERAEIIAVVDADFLVSPRFLSDTVGHFFDPAVGIVQTAQDFRTEGDAPYFRRLRLTYRAFDEVTMPSRNERNAIIFAGTMGLLRRKAVVEAGGWAEWCVTEDAELSLRLLAHGYDALYVETIYGHGVVPLTFSALKRQRFRWCFGGIQILRRHWRLLLRGRSMGEGETFLSLTRAQRYEFLAASLQWFQPLLTLAFSLLALVGAISSALGSPITIRPLVGFFISIPVLLLFVGLTKSLWGLRVRLRVSWVDALATFGFWLAVGWAVAMASLQGLLRTEGAFLSTPKFRERHSVRQAIREARAEALLAAAMVTGGALVLAGGPGADRLFLASLCLWAGLIYSSAPLSAFLAARADLGSEMLQGRRRLEWLRGRAGVSWRPSRYAVAFAVSAVLVVILGSGLASERGGSSIEGLERQLTLPQGHGAPSNSGQHAASSGSTGSTSPGPGPNLTGSPSPAGGGSGASTATPSAQPTVGPTATPSVQPVARPTVTPSTQPTAEPTATSIVTSASATPSHPGPTGRSAYSGSGVPESPGAVPGVGIIALLSSLWASWRLRRSTSREPGS